MEAMKMEHVIESPMSGIVRRGHGLGRRHRVRGPSAACSSRPTARSRTRIVEIEAIDLDAIRPDLAEVLDRQAMTLDEARPEAVARRRKTDQRTARENVDDLCDPGSFVGVRLRS